MKNADQDTLLTTHTTKLTQTDTKLTQIDTKLAQTDTKLTQIDTKLTQIDTTNNTQTTHIDQLYTFANDNAIAIVQHKNLLDGIATYQTT